MVDPLGGSWAIQALTDELERRALDYIAQVDARGGMVRAIDDGFLQRELENAGYRAQRCTRIGERALRVDTWRRTRALVAQAGDMTNARLPIGLSKKLGAVHEPKGALA